MFLQATPLPNGDLNALQEINSQMYMCTNNKLKERIA